MKVNSILSLGLAAGYALAAPLQERNVDEREAAIEKRGFGTILLLGATFAPYLIDAFSGEEKRSLGERDNQDYALYIIDPSALSGNQKRDPQHVDLNRLRVLKGIFGEEKRGLDERDNQDYALYIIDPSDLGGNQKRDPQHVDLNRLRVLKGIFGEEKRGLDERDNQDYAIYLIDPSALNENQKRDLVALDLSGLDLSGLDLSGLDLSSLNVLQGLAGEKRSLDERNDQDYAIYIIDPSALNEKRDLEERDPFLGTALLVGTVAGPFIWDQIKDKVLKNEKRDVEERDPALGPVAAAFIAPAVAAGLAIGGNTIYQLVKPEEKRDLQEREAEADPKINPNVAAIVGSALGASAIAIANPIITELINEKRDLQLIPVTFQG